MAGAHDGTDEAGLLEGEAEAEVEFAGGDGGEA